MMDANYALRNEDGDFAILDFYCDGSERWKFSESLNRSSRFTREAALLRSASGQIPVMVERFYFQESSDKRYAFQRPVETILTSGETVMAWKDIDDNEIIVAHSLLPVYFPQLERNQMELAI